MKKALITGGAGFIGSHLSEHLLSNNYQVTVIDDLSTGSMNNISSFLDNPNFRYLIESCQKRNLMAELIDMADEVYHLAAAVGVKMIVENPMKTIDLNYSLTEIVLEMVEKKQKPVLFTSTSEVYGKSADIPYQEDGDLLFGPSTRWRWSYACSKLLDEFMILGSHRTKGVPAVVVRLFNTVGPRQTGKYGMVIPTFVKQALNDAPLTIFGNGNQARCFCHVLDAVPMFPTLLGSSEAHGNIYNIGSDEEISINELAHTIIKLLNSNSKLEYIPYEKAYNKGFEDMKRRIPSLEKVNSITGFQPIRKLEKIILDVAENIKGLN